MKKIFALYIKVRLTEKPEWFDDFLNKYFEPVDLHITLIQPRYIDKGQVGAVESRVAEVVRNTYISDNDKMVVFNNLVIDEEDSNVFMLRCEKNNFVLHLQENLCSALSEYDSYVEDVTMVYESDFKPHITVAINLSEHDKEKAARYFIDDYRIVGRLEDLVLPIVKNQSVEERNNVHNKRIFALQ